MLVKIAILEDPDQTSSSEAAWSGCALFVMTSWQFKILEHLPYVILLFSFKVLLISVWIVDMVDTLNIC